MVIIPHSADDVHVWCHSIKYMIIFMEFIDQSNFCKTSWDSKQSKSDIIVGFVIEFD